MIAKLRGIIDFIGENHTIIDISGVGYLVHCPSKVINKLSPIGQIDELLIETIVREDQFTLYGFKDEKEKYWFNLLLKVQSIGAKTAINGLSVLSVEELEMAIISEDSDALTRIAGIGKKGALRICAELKDKTFNIPNIIDDGNSNNLMQDAISGLIGLGYGQSEAYSTIAKIDVGDGDKKHEDILQSALKILSEKKQ